MRNRIWVALTCLIVLSALLVSCGPKDTTTTTTTVTGTTTQPTGQTTTTAPTTGATTTAATTNAPTTETIVDALGRTVEKPRYGGTLTLSAGAEQINFDPYKIDQVNVWSSHLTNEKMSVGDFVAGPSGKNEVSWLLPGIWDIAHETGWLCESWEIKGTDTLVFHVRQGVRFHNKAPAYGREMTSADIVASLQRAVSVGMFLGTTFGAGKTGGADHTPSSIIATDKWTVEVKCPLAEFGSVVQFLNVGTRISAKETLDANKDLNDWKLSLGTGPYMLTDFVRDSSMTLTANPDYWRDHPMYPGMKMPFIATIRRIIIPDLSTQLAAIQTGKLDIMRDLYPKDIKSLLASRTDLKKYKNLQYWGNFIWFRLDKDLPQKNLDVRRALSMALDRDAIIAGFYEGEAIKFSHPIMPTGELSDIFTPLDQLPQRIQENYAYNTTMAKQLLTAAGYPNGFNCKIACTAAQVDLLSIVKDQWAKINVNLTLDIKEAAVFTSTSQQSSHDDMLNQILSNVYYTTPLAYVKAYIPVYNHSRGVDDYVEKYFAEKMAPFTTFGDATLRANEKALVPYLLDLLWVIELPTPYRYTLSQPWIKSFNGEYSVGRGNHEDGLMYSWIDQAARTKFIGK